MGLTVGSLFSGIGGLDLGLEWAGLETKWFCEIESFPQQVLKHHWPEVPVYEDVRTITTENAVPVDVIAGGFPCQDISWAGIGRGIDYDLSEQEGTRSGLWWEMWRVIRDFRPRYVIAENVPALTHRGLDIVLGSLAQIGYDAEWQTISAAAVGAPHIRERVFIVAYADGGGIQGQREGLDDACKARQGGEDSKAHGNLDRRGQDGGSQALPEQPHGDVANANGSGFPRRQALRQRGGQVALGQGMSHPSWFAGGVGQPWPVSFKVGDTISEGLEGDERSWLQGEGRKAVGASDTGGKKNEWVETEYDFRGVAYGVSDRVGALKGYGNAVVPQVGYLVGRAVMAHYMEQKND